MSEDEDKQQDSGHSKPASIPPKESPAGPKPDGKPVISQEWAEGAETPQSTKNRPHSSGQKGCDSGKK